jgi:hypothetical protein
MCNGLLQVTKFVDERNHRGGNTPVTYITRFVVVFLAVSLFLSGAASAQWVFLGRKALGKVRQLSSEVKDSQRPGYDVASVLLEAHAEKVYNTAVTMLQAHKEWKITQKDDKSRTLEFTDGRLSAGMQINRLEDNLCQLLIASTGTSGKTGTTSLVVNGVLRVCNEMGVHCQVSDE